MSTLTVTLGKGDELRDETIDRIREAEAGGVLEDDQPVLNFANYAALARLTSEKNLELLETIREHEPSSIREAAKLVERDYKEVHRNLTELEALNVLEFEQEGRAKRPVVRYDSIEVDIPLVA